MQQEVIDGFEVRLQKQQDLYREYALAAEAYVRMPTLDNWEEKEKAFESYNALISGLDG